MKPITLATLPKASAQEVFDWVVSNLLKQGKKSLGGDGNCRYRGKNGLKCAAGWCIGDDEYDRIGENIEGKIWGFSDGVTVPRAHNGLIRELQSVHDDYYAYEWPSKFRKVAEHYGLDASALEPCPT